MGSALSISFEIALLAWFMSAEIVIRILSEELGDETMKMRTMIQKLRFHLMILEKCDLILQINAI
jgi:hypothetical protein